MELKAPVPRPRRHLKVRINFELGSLKRLLHGEPIGVIFTADQYASADTRGLQRPHYIQQIATGLTLGRPMDHTKILCRSILLDIPPFGLASVSLVFRSSRELAMH